MQDSRDTIPAPASVRDYGAWEAEAVFFSGLPSCAYAICSKCCGSGEVIDGIYVCGCTACSMTGIVRRTK